MAMEPLHRVDYNDCMHMQVALKIAKASAAPIDAQALIKAAATRSALLLLQLLGFWRALSLACT